MLSSRLPQKAQTNSEIISNVSSYIVLPMSSYILIKSTYPNYCTAEILILLFYYHHIDHKLATKKKNTPNALNIQSLVTID